MEAKGGGGGKIIWPNAGLELASVRGRKKAPEPKSCWLGPNILENGLEIGKPSKYWKMKTLGHYHQRI